MISGFNLYSVLKYLPRYAIYTLLIFTPLARGSVQGWAVYVIHIITIIALSAFLLEKSIIQEWMRIKTPLDRPISALLILVLLSTFFSFHTRTSIEAFVLFSDYIIIFYLVIQIIRTRSQFRQLVYIIIGMAAFLSVFGFFKIFGVNPFPWWDYTDFASGVNASTFGNPDHLAGYMEMVIPVIIGISMRGYNEGKFFLTTPLTIIMLISLIISNSRGGLFSLIIGLGFMATCFLIDRHFKHKKYLIILAGILPLLLLFAVSNDRLVNKLKIVAEQKEESIDSRITAWNGVVKMIHDYPLVGTGPGTFAFIFTQYQPPGLINHYNMAHNDYLHFTSETGIFFIPIFIWIIISFYKRGFKKMKSRSRLVREITIGSISGVTAMLFHSIVDFNLHIPANAMLFTVLAAMAVAPSPDS